MVDHDDPEKRISELERRLAEPRAAGGLSATQYRLTSERVHNVAFSKPPLFKRGYDEVEVDAFLDVVEAALREPTAGVGFTPADILDVAFSKPPLGARGYDEDEVDAFVDLVELELTRRLTDRDGS